MKYAIAIAACFALFLLYVLIAGFFGWKHGGGAIPILLFIAAMIATWRALTRNGVGLNKYRPSPNYPRSTQPLDAFWAQALEEFAGPERNPALYARLFASFNGDEQRTKAAYLHDRASELQHAFDVENARKYLISKGYTITESTGAGEPSNMSGEALISLARSVKAGDKSS